MANTQFRRYMVHQNDLLKALVVSDLPHVRVAELVQEQYPAAGIAIREIDQGSWDRLADTGCDTYEFIADSRAWERQSAAAVASADKPQLTGLVRDDPKTPEGKYLVKRRDGSVVEWPHFVLSGRDPHAAVALRAYADSIEKDPDCHPGLAKRIREFADVWDKYRAEHGAGDPTRGIHRKDDPDTIAEMKLGWSA